MEPNQVFQLSALSQNDSGAADGSSLYCEVAVLEGVVPQAQPSHPFGQAVHLPIPSENPTPTWWLTPVLGSNDCIFQIVVFCPTDPAYPTTTIVVDALEVIKWGAIPYDERPNQIYSNGIYGIFGFAQDGPNGPIYTITAGVLNPRVHGT